MGDRRVQAGVVVVGCALGVACALLPVMARADGPPPPVKEAIAGAVATTHRPDPTKLKALRPRWATAAAASSEYNPLDWSASQLLGEPNVYPAHGDIAQAWATLGADDDHGWATVRFKEPVEAQAILIVETYNVGAVVRVDDVTDPKRPVALWSGTTWQGGKKSRVMLVTLPAPRRLGAVRVVIDSAAVLGWNEIDAVGLLPTVPDLGPHEDTYSRVPYPDTVQGATLRAEALPVSALLADVRWAQQVIEVSGERSAGDFGASQVLAAPDAYPDEGDNPRAWNPDSQDSGEAWVTVRFDPTHTDRILIVSNASCAAVAQIDDLSDPARPTTLWVGARDTRTQGPQVLTLTLPTERRIDTLRLSLDTRRAPGWEAIDAIGLGL